MSYLLLPAIHLMGRLRYRAKFFVILSLFGLPLTVLAVWLLSGMADRLQTLNEQQTGLATVIDELDRHHQLQQARLAMAGVDDASERRRLLTEALTGAPQALRVNARENGLEATQSELRERLAATADRTGLMTPSSPATRYLVDILVSALPQHMQQTGQLGHAATEATTAGRWTPDLFLAVDNGLTRFMEGLNPLLNLAEWARHHDIDSFEHFKTALADYRNTTEETGESFRRGLIEPQTMAMSSEETRTVATRMLASASTLADALHADLAASLDERAREAQRHRWLITGLLGISVTLLLYLFAGFSLSVSRTIQALNTATSDLAAGNLETRITLRQQDELGEVANQVNEVATGLGELVARVRTTASEVADSSQAMDGLSETLVTEITAQRDALDTVSRAMHDATTAADETARSIQEAADTAVRVNEETATGRERTEETSAAMDQLAGEITEAGEVIKRLDNGMSGVDDILSVITDVSERTGLLALNAAIEAARAGEHGRGFAVVADEVQELARRTRSSADEIREEVARLRGTVGEAVAVMERSATTATSSQQRAQEAGELLHGIDESVATISDLNQRVATAAEEQSAIAQDVNTQLGAASEGVTRASQAGEQTREAARSTAGTVTSLQEALEHFKLGDEVDDTNP